MGLKKIQLHFGLMFIDKLFISKRKAMGQEQVLTVAVYNAGSEEKGEVRVKRTTVVERKLAASSTSLSDVTQLALPNKNATQSPAALNSKDGIVAEKLVRILLKLCVQISILKCSV